MNALGLLHDVDRARAAELARAGDHAGAVRILGGLDRDPATADLLARVHAQRGDLAAARAVWAEVLAADPDHESALAGTRLITDITTGRRWAHPVPVVPVAGALAVVAAVLAAVLVPPPDERPAAAPAPTTQPTTTQPIVATSVVPDTSALMAALAGPEVRLAPLGTGVRVVFLDGLFPPDGTSPTPRGRAVLERWGRALHGRGVRVTVTGHGLVVPGGPVTGGSATALARAVAAAEVLAAAGEQPPAAFTLRSAEQPDLPHPGADPALNRTVTLRVDPL